MPAPVTDGRVGLRHIREATLRPQVDRESQLSVSENKEIVRRYFEERYNDRNYDVVDQFLAPSADIEGGKKAWLAKYHAAWSDTRLTIDHLVAEGDLVAAHITMEATHVGDWAGFAPSGKRLTVRGMSLFRLADGKDRRGQTQLQQQP